MTQDYLVHPTPTKREIRLQNQLEAVRCSLLGTNADILVLMSMVPVTPETQAIIARIERRLKALGTLQTTSKR